MANYVNGVFSGNVSVATSTYNLLISGAGASGSDYAASSGIYLANDIHSNKGAQLSFANTGNTYMDFNAASTNSMNFRYTSNGSTLINMLSLMTDDQSAARFVATAGGRVQASQFMVNASYNETRIAPNMPGTYVGQNATGSYFMMNPNGATGNQGFAFISTNTDGTPKQVNLNLIGNGYVQVPYYNQTTSSDDSETVAVAGLDTNGNLIRSYATNKRIRAVEASVATLSADLTSGLQNKVNEIVSRLNGLNFFSNQIAVYQVPTQVQGLAATNGTGNSSVSFTLLSGFNQNSTTAGGAGPINYTVLAYPSGSTTAVSGNFTSNASPIVVTGLTAGIKYSFYITASNNSGTSIASNALYATPV